MFWFKLASCEGSAEALSKRKRVEDSSQPHQKPCGFMGASIPRLLRKSLCILLLISPGSSQNPSLPQTHNIFIILLNLQDTPFQTPHRLQHQQREYAPNKSSRKRRAHLRPLHTRIAPTTRFNSRRRRRTCRWRGTPAARQSSSREARFASSHINPYHLRNRNTHPPVVVVAPPLPLPLPVPAVLVAAAETETPGNSVSRHRLGTPAAKTEI